MQELSLIYDKGTLTNQRKVDLKIVSIILKRRNRNSQKHTQDCMDLDGNQRNANESNSELPFLPFRLAKAI